MRNKLIDKLSKYIPKEELIKLFKHNSLRKIQKEALKVLNKEKNLIVSAPTASGKTWIAELFALYWIYYKKRKVVYTAPLKALTYEKFNDFKKYNFKVALSTGDLDSDDKYLKNFDMIFTTTEKLDSLIRHNASWINDIGLLIIDEIHLIDDISRGPVVEMIIAHLEKVNIVGLSATISNAEEIASWLNANLIKSDERPIKLKYGVLHNNEIMFDF